LITKKNRKEVKLLSAEFLVVLLHDIVLVQYPTKKSEKNQKDEKF